MWKRLRETLGAYQQRDPAARSKLEIFLLYPGVHAPVSYTHLDVYKRQGLDKTQNRLYNKR